jgi:hypothetical protein
MKQIHKIELEGKVHYIKVGGLFKSAREVYPIRIDGKIAWKNLLIGSSKQLFTLLVYVAIAAALYFGFHQILEQCEWIINNQICYNKTMVELPARTLPSIVIP